LTPKRRTNNIASARLLPPDGLLQAELRPRGAASEIKLMATKIYGICWHGRGGQGAKTAATMVADVALTQGKYSQGFPEYGPERMGAPMRGYTRISEKPITVHSSLEAADVLKSLKLKKGQKVYVVNATKIAIEAIGRPIPNTPMIGALMKVTGLLPVEAFAHDIEKKFAHKFGQKVVDGNLKALKQAFEEVRSN
jgi:pyruvate ferredoxin oxidoreductase gamma subunit